MAVTLGVDGVMVGVHPPTSGVAMPAIPNSRVSNLAPLIPAAEAAAHLGVRPQTLRSWRWRGVGPRYIRLGDTLFARVVYREADIEAWLAEREAASTAEEAAPPAASAGTDDPSAEDVVRTQGR